MGPFYQVSLNLLGYPGKHVLLSPSTDEETEAFKPLVRAQQDLTPDPVLSEFLNP